MSSQYGEHENVLAYFAGRRGRFLDVGAADGLTFSNTAPLLAAGWHGVMVEPSLDNLRWLIENYGENPRVEIVALPLAQNRGSTGIWEGREYSTLLASHKDRIITSSMGERTFRERMTCAIDWPQLITWYGADYNFINIDVEGMNLELLEAMPFDMPEFRKTSTGVKRLKPEMVCIELDPASAQPRMERVFTAVGLTKQQVVGGNLLAWR